MMTILTPLEAEEQAAYDRGIDVQYCAPADWRLRGEPSQAIWRRGYLGILISRRLLDAEKLELLLHERGHLETHNTAWKRSGAASELHAWAWAYEHYLPEKRLLEAAERFYIDDALDVAALADHFSITPRFIAGALDYYRIAAPLLYDEPDAAQRLHVL